MALDKPIHEIAERDIQQLIENGVSEGRDIEYKSVLVGKSSDDRKKFLANISSFANAAGGDLILGMKAQQGIAAEISGLGNVDFDTEISRLEGMCRDGIKPRMAPWLQMKAIPVAGEHVILIRVPRSWSMPHMVTFEHHNKFYSRNSNGKYLLDVDEIRSAFLRSETLAQRIRDFRVNRLSMISSGQTPVSMEEGPKLALHMVPANFADPGVRLDLHRFERKYIKLLGTTGSTGPYYNLDGLVSVDGRHSYTQLFWSGAIETVTSSLLRADSPGTTLTKFIPSVTLEQDVLEAGSELLSIQRELGVSLPIIVMLSFLNIRGFTLAADWKVGNSLTLSDRDDLILHEALVHDFSTPSNVFLRPVIDSVWNAFGFRGSPFFDEQGNWNPPP